MRKVFRIYVKSPDAVKAGVEIKEGMGIGVIAYQDLVYDLEPEVYKSTMFIASLIEREREFRDEVISTNIEELPF